MACPLLGDAITDDTLLNIARLLPTAKDLLCLKLTNSRFAAKAIATAPRPAQGVQPRQWLRCCASRRRRGGCGWRVAASRSATGCCSVVLRAGCV